MFIRILAGIALVILLVTRPEISSALGAYDNGFLALLTPVIFYAIVVVGPIVVVASMAVAITIWALALLLNLAVLVFGRNRPGYVTAAKATLFVLSALVFVGLLLAIINFGDVFVKGGDAERVSISALAFPTALAFIALVY